MRNECNAELRTECLLDEVVAERVLERVEIPVARRNVLLTSGRRVEIEVEDGQDRIVVHAASGGRVILDIELTDAGPRLSFHSAEVSLTAARTLSLAASEITVEAAHALALSSGGELREHVAGNLHSCVKGDARLEAAAVELQASLGGVAVRSCEKITLDGARIGLNDDPCPQPFAWSSLSERSDEP